MEQIRSSGKTHPNGGDIINEAVAVQGMGRNLVQGMSSPFRCPTDLGLYLGSALPTRVVLRR